MSSSVGAESVLIVILLKLQPDPPPRRQRFGVDVLGGGQVLDRDAQRLEDGDVFGRQPALNAAEQEVAEVAQEVVLGDRSFLERNEEVAGLLQDRFAAVAEEAGAADRR